MFIKKCKYIERCNIIKEKQLLDNETNILHVFWLLMWTHAEFTLLHDLHDRLRCLYNLHKLRQCGQQGPAYDAC